MSRETYHLVFNKHITRLEKEKVKQVLICFAKHAPLLSSHLDWEVVNNYGMEFKRRPIGIVSLILDELANKFPTSAYLCEAMSLAQSEIKSESFRTVYLHNDALELDIKLQEKEKAHFRKEIR